MGLNRTRPPSILRGEDEPARARGGKLRILYIAGWGRSGSTLLDRMLGRIPGFFSLGEVRDIWQRGCIENRACGCGSPFRSCEFWSRVGEEAFGGWDELDAREMVRLRLSLDRPWTVPLLIMPSARPAFEAKLSRYVEGLERLYRAIQKVSGAEVIIDSSKICSYALALAKMPDTDLRMLHLVRDSRGVVFSWQKRVARPDGRANRGNADLMERYDVISASGRYLFYNGLAHLMRFLRLPYLLMRYEDLIADPRPNLARIARHAGIPLGRQALSFVQDGSVTLGTNHTVDGNPMRFENGSVRLRVDEEWRRNMKTTPRLLVSAITSPLLLRYRYPVKA